MLSVRMRQLLTAAADALGDGQIPMSDHFLRTNEVTFEEAHLLADLMVTCMRAFLRMPAHQQGATFIIGASKDMDGIDAGYITAIAIRQDHASKLNVK